MNEEPRHQVLREMLGAYALGHLDPTETDQIGRHLDGCPTCRADLQEIIPVARRLDDVDPTMFESPPMPPPDLAERIRLAVARERRERQADELGERRAATAQRRSIAVRRSWVAAAVVLVALLSAGAVGGWIGRTTAPTAATVPIEPISMVARDSSDVSVESAGLVAHTWGVELRIVAAGFPAGRSYRAAFRTEDGRLTPAGEFRGVGDAEMTCFLQSSALREDVTEVVVTDPRGRTVLSADL